MSRCTGHCCTDIHLRDPALEVLTSPTENGCDEDFILDMLKFVKYTDTGATFECSHFDGKNCTAYEQRPQMCRDYPYGKPCSREGCTRTET